LRLGQLRGFFQGAIFTLANLGVLMFILFSPPSIEAGELTFAQAIAFFAWQEMLIWPMIAFGWTMALFQRGMASVQRLEAIFNLEPDVADPATPSPDTPPAGGTVDGAVEFRNVTFRWRDDGEPVLDAINFSVPAGGTVAFLGPIGAGKTTIARMISRLIDPTTGQVLIDGIDAREWRLAQLRRAVGYAPQDSFLFSETIAYNISFALDDAGESRLTPERAAEIRAKVAHAGRLAALDHDVANFPGGYDQVIGERGVTLSGGQKQRVALARALLAEPRILVLDDSFSAVDTDTEERILAGLREVIGRCTTVLIAHRVSTVRHADRIYVLDKGRIIEQGTDEELMSLGGYYADMAARQRLQAEVEAL
ncbi:MAG: ABC transporter ATP-binding protein, partial [Planctomycetota bacterium]